ncbi:MAG: hypothetical protein O2795_10890 [Acidobacteria bacterium]|nr:hypothetical protein [Acidobacteriota bacterium]
MTGTEMLRTMSSHYTLVAATVLLFVLGLAPHWTAQAAEPAQKKVRTVVGIIPQIATGGGSFFMDFQFVNNSEKFSSVHIEFFDSSGVQMTVPLTSGGFLYTNSKYMVDISPQNTLFVSTQRDAPEVQIGYAVVTSDPPNAGVVHATFNQVIPGRPLFQAFIPLDDGSRSLFYLPSVNSNGRTSSMAVMSVTNQGVRYLALDQGGNVLCDSLTVFNQGQHEAFIVPERLPCLAGIDGMVLVAGDPESGIFGVGITAQDGGALVTQPVIPAAPTPVVSGS